MTIKTIYKLKNIGSKALMKFISRIIKIALFTFALSFSALSFAQTTGNNAQWIDVRTAPEYAIDHIEGDRLIPHNDIISGIKELFPDKDTEIHLYCRSGRRSGIATEALQAAGYTNVTNQGSIGEAREARELSKQ